MFPKVETKFAKHNFDGALDSYRKISFIPNLSQIYVMSFWWKQYEKKVVRFVGTERYI